MRTRTATRPTTAARQTSIRIGIKTARKHSVLGLTGPTLFICAAALLCVSCGGGSSSSPSTSTSSDPPAPAVVPLTAADVNNVVKNAVLAVNAPMVVAVADRAGNVLAVFQTPGAPTTAIGNFGNTVSANDLAVSLARTAAYFSNDMAPLSSRTVRFISGIHFPPGVAGTPNADLYGIENTNRGCTLSTNFLPGQSLNPSLSLEGTPGLGIITGKADVYDSQPFAVNPGGIPLFKGGPVTAPGVGVVGGVGVVSTTSTGAINNPVVEYAALVGAIGSNLLNLTQGLPPPGVVIVGGIALPFATQTTLPTGMSAGNMANYTGGNYVVPATAGVIPPDGYLVGPNAGSVLSASDVNEMI